MPRINNPTASFAAPLARISTSTPMVMVRVSRIGEASMTTTPNGSVWPASNSPRRTTIHAIRNREPATTSPSSSSRITDGAAAPTGSSSSAMQIATGKTRNPASRYDGSGIPYALVGGRRLAATMAAVHEAAPMPTSVHATRARPALDTAAIPAHTTANSPQTANDALLAALSRPGLDATPRNR